MQENIIIGFLCGSVTTLAGSLVTHLLSKERDRRRESNQAASTFRNTFERIMAAIQQNPHFTVRQIVDDILIKNYPDQRIAMGGLSRQMRRIKRRAFCKAWQEYVDPENCSEEPFLSYCGSPWETGKSYDRQYILRVISRLISFANR